MSACVPKMPALGMTTSIPPKTSAALAMARAIWSSCVTSATKGRTAAPAGATAASRAPASMSMASTFAPSRANSFAAARPMPDAAPVMTATLPSTRAISPSFSVVGTKNALPVRDDAREALLIPSGPALRAGTTSPPRASVASGDVQLATALLQTEAVTVSLGDDVAETGNSRLYAHIAKFYFYRLHVLVLFEIVIHLLNGSTILASSGAALRLGNRSRFEVESLSRHWLAPLFEHLRK